MDPLTEQIIADSKALLAQVGPAIDAQKKVAALEVDKTSLLSKVASLEQSKLAIEATLKTAADKAAEFFDVRGMLKVSSEDFSLRLQTHPEEIFTVMQKFTDATTQKEAGYPAEGSIAESDLDPIEKFARS